MSQKSFWMFMAALALAGCADPNTPDPDGVLPVVPEQVLALASELSAAGADWQLHAFGNTQHAFSNPNANNPELGTVYDADADRRAWVAVAEFLAERLP